MASNKQQQGGGVIIMTIILAMFLMLVPLPDQLRFFRPEFVVMTLIYWAMALPWRVGIAVAWSVGLLMDVMLGGILGILALAYAFIIYLVLQFHLQLRQYPLWQQSLSVMSLVLLVHITTVVMSPKVASLQMWLPAVTSTLMWPLMYSILRKLRRAFQVS